MVNYPVREIDNMITFSQQVLLRTWLQLPEISNLTLIWNIFKSLFGVSSRPVLRVKNARFLHLKIDTLIAKHWVRKEKPLPFHTCYRYVAWFWKIITLHDFFSLISYVDRLPTYCWYLKYIRYFHFYKKKKYIKINK